MALKHLTFHFLRLFKIPTRVRGKPDVQLQKERKARRKKRKHFKELGITSGSHFYRWLKKNSFPLGFRTLCMNCQMITRFENRGLKTGG